MHKIKFLYVIFLTLSMQLISQQNSQQHNQASNVQHPKPLDATQEVNEIDNQTSAYNDKLDQTVINNFAGIVQSFINIVQQPDNPAVIGTSIAQMLGGILNVAVEIFKKIPHLTNKEDQEEYLEKLENALSQGLRLIKRVKTATHEL